MRDLTIECLEWIMQQTEVPATTAATCGNYLMHDLPMAKYYAKKYLNSLQSDFHSEYSKLQVITGDGLQFADA
jgi:S-ribosylhomocysteine lyase